MREKNNYRENVRLYILWSLKKRYFFTSKIARRNEEIKEREEKKRRRKSDKCLRNTRDRLKHIYLRTRLIHTNY